MLRPKIVALMTRTQNLQIHSNLLYCLPAVVQVKVHPRLYLNCCGQIFTRMFISNSKVPISMNVDGGFEFDDLVVLVR